MFKTDHIRITLVEPEQARNIGAVIRVAANCGLTQVTIVRDNKLSVEEMKDVRLASSGAIEIVELRTCSTIAEAVQGSSFVVGTSGRQRAGSMPVFSKVAQCAAEVHTPPMAIVFGRESTGLTNDELMQCDAQLKLPVNQQFPSMNLAHAVAIVLWEALYMATFPAAIPVAPVDQIANRDLQERWLEKLHLEPAALSQVRQLLRRAQPTTDEMSLLFNLLKDKGRFR